MAVVMWLCWWQWWRWWLTKCKRRIGARASNSRSRRGGRACLVKVAQQPGLAGLEGAGAGEGVPDGQGAPYQLVAAGGGHGILQCHDRGRYCHVRTHDAQEPGQATAMQGCKGTWAWAATGSRAAALV